MAHFSSALRLLLQRPLASVFGAVALALGLVLAGLSWWVLDVVGNAQSAIEDQIVVRARLDPKLDEAATQTTLLALLEVPGVGTAEWVGPEAQKTELTKLLGEDLLAGLDEAVFPRGGLVRLTIERGTVSDASDLEAMLTAVKKVDHVEGVADVPFDPRHLAFLFDAAAVARIVGLGLALLALLAGPWRSTNACRWRSPHVAKSSRCTARLVPAKVGSWGATSCSRCSSARWPRASPSWLAS